jgi:hypothetical protein
MTGFVLLIVVITGVSYGRSYPSPRVVPDLWYNANMADKQGGVH